MKNISNLLNPSKSSNPSDVLNKFETWYTDHNELCIACFDSFHNLVVGVVDPYCGAKKDLNIIPLPISGVECNWLC